MGKNYATYHVSKNIDFNSLNETFWDDLIFNLPKNAQNTPSQQPVYPSPLQPPVNEPNEYSGSTVADKTSSKAPTPY